MPFFIWYFQTIIINIHFINFNKDKDNILYKQILIYTFMEKNI